MPRAKPPGQLTRLSPALSAELRQLQSLLSTPSTPTTIQRLVEAYRWRRIDLLLASLRHEVQRGLEPGQVAQLQVLRDYLNWLLP